LLTERLCKRNVALTGELNSRSKTKDGTLSNPGAKKESGQPVKWADRSPKNKNVVCQKCAPGTEPKAFSSGMCHDAKTNCTLKMVMTVFSTIP
jgi:hypothetical protein